MSVVTLNGPIGAGGPEIGTQVAKKLACDYVDRLILAEAAKRIGATVQAMAGKEGEVLRRRDRIGRFLQSILERSAVSAAGAEPYFGPGIETILARDYYSQVGTDPITESQDLDDQKFIQVTKDVIMDLAQSGNVVIVGRGSNRILKDMPAVLHIGFIAPQERRVRTIMDREHLTYSVAEEFANNHEKARVAFFDKFFKCDPQDPALYHLMINMADLSTETAAQLIANVAQDVVSPQHMEEGLG